MLELVGDAACASQKPSRRTSGCAAASTMTSHTSALWSLGLFDSTISRSRLGAKVADEAPRRRTLAAIGRDRPNERPTERSVDRSVEHRRCQRRPASLPEFPGRRFWSSKSRGRWFTHRPARSTSKRPGQRPIRALTRSHSRRSSRICPAGDASAARADSAHSPQSYRPEMLLQSRQTPLYFASVEGLGRPSHSPRGWFRRRSCITSGRARTDGAIAMAAGPFCVT
jgi:hypothetical protein